MQKPVILVSGKNGQLGHALQTLAPAYTAYDFVFLSREELDLSKPATLKDLFDRYYPAYFINCAAYTAVDKAESDQQTAWLVNSETVGQIAVQCNFHNTKLIHISTDYVFNGNGDKPYKEDEQTDPINYYGYTKWLGEKMALENNPQSVIIRTSWVYSYHGANFVKTMLRLMKERPEIKVVSDQLGSPTYAFDLAEAILVIVNKLQSTEVATASNLYGIYHFSNSGIISWHQFASTIKDIAGFNCIVHAIPSSNYPTPAKRPFYSAMNTTKIQNSFGVQLKDWKESLQACIQQLQQA